MSSPSERKKDKMASIRLRINLILISGVLCVMTAPLWIASTARAQSNHESGRASSARTTKPFAFEVVSIRPHKPGAIPFDLQITPDGYRATTSIGFAIELAYFPPDWRKWPSWKIKNAPAWVTSDWYDVDARVAPEDLAAWHEEVTLWQKSHSLADLELLRSAWLSVLRERCKISVHMTPSEAPYLDLVQGKHGTKLKETVPGAVKPVKLKTSKLGDGFFIQDGGERRFVGVTMEELAVLLTRLSPEYPVEDRTGLKGRYDFTVPWYDYRLYPNSEFSDPLDRMPLKNVGLMLKRGRGPAYIINVDHIERPDPN